jgi:hypothetical protein
MSGRREQNPASGDMTGMRVAVRKPEQFGILLPSSADFERHLPLPGRDLLLPRSLTGVILASKPRASGECRISSPPAADVQWLGGLEVERRSIKKLW